MKRVTLYAARDRLFLPRGGMVLCGDEYRQPAQEVREIGGILELAGEQTHLGVDEVREVRFAELEIA